MTMKPNEGGKAHPIYKLCQTFEGNPPSYLAIDGCLALAYIDECADKLGSEVRTQLYEFRESLDSDEPLVEHVKRHGITRVLRIGFMLWPNEFRNYLARQARLMTDRRIIVRQESFYREVFGINVADFRSGGSEDSICTFKRFRASLYEVIGEEERCQRKALPDGNAAEMRLDSDKWVMCWVKGGTSVQSATYDFSGIVNPHFKVALKCYLKENRWRNKKSSFRGQNGVTMLPRVFNYLSEELGVAVPGDVTVTHVRRLVQFLCTETVSFKGAKMKMAAVRGHFKYLNQIFDWLMRSDVNHPDGQPKVQRNPFRSVSFKNEDDHTDKAQYIPEEIVMQLMNHRYELPPEVNRCLTIMLDLGLRLSDCVMLEQGCLTYDDDIEMHVLRFIDQKNKKRRIRAGLSPYHLVGVKDLDVVKAIQEQERASEDLRKLTDSRLIFLRKHSVESTKVNVLSTHGLITAIRLLISKRGITDHDGNLWHFKSHQCRKTVAVTMIENGATPIEIKQFLGHLDQKTTESYYAEVRKLKQGELNHAFFEKKFKARVSKEQLEKFSEEERRILYTEFALGHRNVELGLCVKHASEGPCGNRKGETNCATCKSICTGPQYEPKWQKLVDDAEHDVETLLAVYHEAGIQESEYCDYAEFRKANKLLLNYRVALAEIKSYGS